MERGNNMAEMIKESKNKKEEQTALDEINDAIKSYNVKMTKAQLK